MAYQSLRLEYLQIPPVSRAYTTACVLTTAAVVSRALPSRPRRPGRGRLRFGPRGSPEGQVSGAGGGVWGARRGSESRGGGAARQGCGAGAAGGFRQRSAGPARARPWEPPTREVGLEGGAGRGCADQRAVLLGEDPARGAEGSGCREEEPRRGEQA